MDDTAELHQQYQRYQRQTKLLDNNNLRDSIKNMIKVKGFHAKLDSVTTIWVDRKREIVLRLLISKSNIDRVVKTYIYLTEDMFDLDSFKYIDKELGISISSIRNISTDALIKLRALRVVYNVIKNISNTDGPSGIAYVRTRQDGLCDWS